MVTTYRIPFFHRCHRCMKLKDTCNDYQELPSPPPEPPPEDSPPEEPLPLLEGLEAITVEAVLIVEFIKLPKLRVVKAVLL
jgi:hypothetical protein